MLDQRNLILAVVLSLAIILGFEMIFRPASAPDPTPETTFDADGLPVEDDFLPAPSVEGMGLDEGPGIIGTPARPGSREAVLAQTADQRISIETPSLHGSIPLVGGRIDDLTLVQYRETPDPDSPEIVLFSPSGTPRHYYAQFGWVTDNPDVRVPDQDSVWSANQSRLVPYQPLTMTWDNGEGLLFERVIELDEHYMFSVTQRVRNYGNQTVTLHPYGLVNRGYRPDTLGFFILHEGPIGVLNGSLKELKYGDLESDGPIQETTTGGWIGITDKYWLAALVPDQQQSVHARFSHSRVGGGERYQTDILAQPKVIPPGQTMESTDRLFAGAKEVRLLDMYEETLGIHRFDLAVDFGWFYFLTKPFFYALDWLHGILGNFGLAILAFTVVIKLIFFPLANKSYRALSKMKKLQPEMKKLQERFKDDKTRLNQELMALYKREKANPVAGCLPIVIQIPVFFALYKVLFVTIEMRHAPFYGWINDLSAQDPTSLFNLFGLLPWDTPPLLTIGIWPIIMGATMFLQMRLNPQPTDPIQQKVLFYLPFIFTVMLAQFPAGLVIYWAWNNLLSIAQQRYIMYRMGV